MSDKIEDSYLYIKMIGLAFYGHFNNIHFETFGVAYTGLQMRVGIADNSKIILLISQ